jgi:hypothetical protein
VRDFIDLSRPVICCARVLGIPTPMWQAHGARFYGSTMPAQMPLSHQERAHTNPFWYPP